MMKFRKGIIGLTKSGGKRILPEFLSHCLSLSHACTHAYTHTHTHTHTHTQSERERKEETSIKNTVNIKEYWGKSLFLESMYKMEEGLRIKAKCRRCCMNRTSKLRSK